jgi:ankyrin repeat protein
MEVIMNALSLVIVFLCLQLPVQAMDIKAPHVRSLQSICLEKVVYNEEYYPIETLTRLPPLLNLRAYKTRQLALHLKNTQAGSIFRWDTIFQLIQEGADVNAITLGHNNGTDKVSLLFLAVIKENPLYVEKLLRAGANPNIAYRNKISNCLNLHILPLAIRNNTIDLLKIMHLLLDAGADPNKPGFDRKTPLHEAARWGNIKATLLLLRYGAHPLMKDARDNTSLDYAQAEYHSTHYLKSRRKEFKQCIMALQQALLSAQFNDTLIIQ